jgi:hypothetical protein
LFNHLFFDLDFLDYLDFLVFSLYFGSERIEASFDILVASVYLFDIADGTGSIGTHRGYQQGYSCSDVRTGHALGTKGHFAVVSDNNGTVGVAEDNLGSHVDELVDKE